MQVLYGRLLNCKQAAAAEAAAFKRPINPVAIRLGLAEPDQQHMGVQSGDNPAEGYYGHLLDMSEKLFGAEIDAPTYEETLRVMFGTKAYVMFTLDKVVAAIIKLVCHVFPLFSVVSCGCRSDAGPGKLLRGQEDCC